MSRHRRSTCVVAILGLFGLATLLGACGMSGPPTPPQATEIVSYTFTPPSPAVLKFGEDVTVDLTYTSGFSAPIRMWAIIDYDGPITDGTLSYCPSPAITAKQGTVERCFSVEEAFIDGQPAPLHVDTIELNIVDHAQTVDLYEELVAVDYTWEP